MPSIPRRKPRARQMASKSDAELLRLTHKKSDSEAFGAFYLRHQNALLAFLTHHTGNPDVAQDLVAESFAVAYDKVWSYDPARGEARRWLFGIARIVLLSSFRQHGAEQATRRKLGLSAPAQTDEVWDAAEERLDASMAGLVEGLDALSDDERDAVIARVIEEREYADIARGEGASEAAVRQRVSRGLRKLAKVTTRT
jgi:RNA polymerase sigma factor (sigma-70 family)